MSDIVERLRSHWSGERIADVSTDVADAADQIEKLTNELADAKAENERMRNVLFGEVALEMLLAGKKSLFSCSESPEIEDARSCFQAMVGAAFPEKEKA